MSTRPPWWSCWGSVEFTRPETGAEIAHNMTHGHRLAPLCGVRAARVAHAGMTRPWGAGRRHLAAELFQAPSPRPRSAVTRQ